MSEKGNFQLIRGQSLVADEWQVILGDGVDVAGRANGVSSAPTGADAKLPLLPLQMWVEQRQELLARKATTGARLGVWLEPTDDPCILADDLASLDLVAVHFPKFVDGRGYSTASLLRQRYGYPGELRAFGDVGRDQLFYLARVGFDSFLIPAGRDAAAALGSLDDFPESYQSAVDQAIPLFRRRESQPVA